MKRCTRTRSAAGGTSPLAFGASIKDWVFVMGAEARRLAYWCAAFRRKGPEREEWF
jgi:hypothetical protein